MSKKQPKQPPLEQGLLLAMQSLDKQIARELQRSPEELQKRGVKKWQAYSDRIERVAGFTLERFSKNELTLDSLLVLAQAYPKVLKLLAEELGSEGLGKLRTGYCEEAFAAIERDAHQAQELLSDSPSIN